MEEDLELDSLDTVELIMTLEDEFSIQISDEEASDIKTVSQLIEFISTKLHK